MAGGGAALSMDGLGQLYSPVIAAAGGGLIATEICEAIRNAKITAGTHISRKN
jgi:hypothetical protein